MPASVPTMLATCSGLYFHDLESTTNLHFFRKFNPVSVKTVNRQRTDIGSELNCKIETKKHQIRQAITASQSNCKAVN